MLYVQEDTWNKYVLHALVVCIQICLYIYIMKIHLKFFSTCRPIGIVKIISMELLVADILEDYGNCQWSCHDEYGLKVNAWYKNLPISVSVCLGPKWQYYCIEKKFTSSSGLRVKHIWWLSISLSKHSS